MPYIYGVHTYVASKVMIASYSIGVEAAESSVSNKEQ